MSIQKILIVTDAPSPYKMDFLRLIEEYYQLHILFLNTTLMDRDPRWFASCQDFSHEILPKNLIGKIYRGLTMDISDYDLFWNMNYTHPICWVLAKRFHKKHKPVLMHADGGIYKDRGFLINTGIKQLLKMNDYFTSSGILNDQYYHSYGIATDRIFHYHFSSIHESEIISESRSTVMHPIRLLSVGQPIHRKGFDILLNALVPFAFEKAFSLTIVGGEPNQECQMILRKFPQLEEIVRFVPFVEKKDLAQFYRNADYFVFPTREDIWGLVINEALAFGLPIISTDRCAAMVEIYRKYPVGEIVKSNDVKALKNALSKLLNNRAYSDASAQALKAANSYTIESMLNDYLNIFHEIEGMRE